MRTLFKTYMPAGSAKPRPFFMSKPKTRSASKKPTVFATAKILGVHRTTLENWRNEGCPGLPPGAVNLTAVRRWADRNGKRADGIDPARATFRKKLITEQHRKLKLANDAVEDRLISRKWMAKRFGTMMSDLEKIRAKSEIEDTATFVAIHGDIAVHREAVRRFWDNILTKMQALAHHFDERKKR